MQQTTLIDQVELHFVIGELPIRPLGPYLHAVEVSDLPPQPLPAMAHMTTRIRAD